MGLFDELTRSQHPSQPPFAGLSIILEGGRYCWIIRLWGDVLSLFSAFPKAITDLQICGCTVFTGLQCVWVKKRERKGVKESVMEREREKEREKSGEEGELQSWWLNGRTTNFLILCFILAKEMKTVKSQRGAKSAAQYGTAHQNPLGVMINASAAQNRKRIWVSNVKFLWKNSVSGWSDIHQRGEAPTRLPERQQKSKYLMIILMSSHGSVKKRDSNSDYIKCRRIV